MEKGSAVVVLVIIILILSAILVYISWVPRPGQKALATPTPVASLAPQPTPTESPIKNSNQLDDASTSLDTTALDAIDSELNKIDSDAAF